MKLEEWGDTNSYQKKNMHFPNGKLTSMEKNYANKTICLNMYTLYGWYLYLQPIEEHYFSSKHDYLLTSELK